jgi:iron complex transport system substrate-binding protein
VIAANPDVILLTDGGNDGGQSLATVRARPGWANIAAVKSGRVHEISADVFTRPGPRIADAVEQLVKLLYPDVP